MRNLFLIIVISILAFSCGEAGIGFNIQKEFPVEIPVDIDPTVDFPGSLPGVNPPAITREDEYSLEGAGFSTDDISNLDEVLVKSLAYEIANVQTSVALDAITITLENSTGGNIVTINVPINSTTNQLENVAKTVVSDPSGIANLQSALDNNENVKIITSFDFAEVPTSQFKFDFLLYFDVVVKVRDL